MDGSSSPQEGRIRVKLFAALASVVLTAALLEASTYALVRLGVLSTPVPTRHLSGFWEGNHPKYGVWHRPGASGRHGTPCFDVEYRTNSAGARDVERAIAGGAPRVVVLGDSFIEGWGVSNEARLTGLLERHLGIEHLNFGMSHFGPYQELLVYRDLARRYSHDRVLLAITPVNDFFDLDIELSRDATWYEHRYRPYLVGRYPHYEHRYLREPFWRRLPRRYSYAYNALGAGVDRLRGAWKPPWTSPSLKLTHSFFYDFEDRQFALLRHVLEELRAEAEGKRLAVALLPVFLDFARFTQMKGEQSELGRRLEALGAERGFDVVDLLPAMHREDPHWKYYFHGCDYHYNELGNRIAFESLVETLAPGFYEKGGES